MTPRLINQLSAADKNDRLDAAFALGLEPSQEATAALVERAGVEADFTVREAITWALVQHGEVSVPLVAAKLSEADPVVRRQAAHVLSKIGGQAVAGHIDGVVADENDEVAVKGFRAAARSGDPAVIPGLIRRLGTGDQELQDALAVALSSLGEIAVAPLVDALGHHWSAVRAHAADCLGHLGSPGADPAAQPLAALLDDPDAEVRFAAVSALGELAPELTGQALATARDSSDGRVATIARHLTSR